MGLQIATIDKERKVEAARELLARRHARRNMLDFMDYVWWKRSPFLVGTHTQEIADRLTRAVDDYLEGVSTFLGIKVPFRHGKSDLVSRAFVTYFLGRAHGNDPDVIMSGYGSSLVTSFSRRCKAIINSERYQSLWPLRISPRNNTQDKWSIEGSTGEVIAVGLGGAITGHGGDLITFDDYCKKREEAESEVYRDKTWEAFRDDLMTRRAPTSIVVICATPWNVDDVFGRIEAEVQNNDDFPQFEYMEFPAKSEQYPTGYLFPERFSPEWYESQYATLGPYSASGLLDVNPVLRGGNLFNTDNIQYHNSIDEFPDCPLVRAWDLASTEKERIKDDPDWTAGVKLGVTYEKDVPHIWIHDVKACQKEAPARDALIKKTAEEDGGGVSILVESVAGYKDTYTQLRKILYGRRVVKKVLVSGEKLVRAQILEPAFEAGNVHVPKNAGWRRLFEKHFSEFPSGRHDDIVDATAIAFTDLYKKKRLVKTR